MEPFIRSLAFPSKHRYCPFVAVSRGRKDLPLHKDICPPGAYALAGIPAAVLMGLCLYGIELRAVAFKHDEQTLRKAAAKNQQHWIDRTFRTLCHRLDIRIDFQASELCSERLHSDTPLLILSNHRSYMDILAIGSLLREHSRTDVRWVIKKEIERWPFIGRSCNASGSLFVSRDKRQGHAVLHSAANMAQIAREDGADVVLFPEGTRFKEADPDSDLQHTLEPNPLIVMQFLNVLSSYSILSLTLSMSETPHASPRRTFNIRADIMEPPPRSIRALRPWLQKEWRRKEQILKTA